MTLARNAIVVLLVAAIVAGAGARAGATAGDPIEDALVAIVAEARRLRDTNATLLAQTADLKAQLGAANINVAAYAATHRQLAARIDRTTALLGGTPPPPSPYNLGRGIDASLVALQGAAKAAADKLAQPPPPPPPVVVPVPEILAASRLRLYLERGARTEEIHEAGTRALAWLQANGFTLREPWNPEWYAAMRLASGDGPNEPPAVASGVLGGGMVDGIAVGEGYVEIRLTPAVPGGYLEPWREFLAYVRDGVQPANGAPPNKLPVIGHAAE